MPGAGASRPLGKRVWPQSHKKISQCVATQAKNREKQCCGCMSVHVCGHGCAGKNTRVCTPWDIARSRQEVSARVKPCAGCEVEGLERGRGRMLASSPVTNPALGTITSGSGLAAVNYGHLPAADTAGPCGRRHCLGSAPASASSGLPRDGQSWEPALHGGGAQPSQDGTPIVSSALAAPLSHSAVERSSRVRLQNRPGAAHAPTGARRSPAAGRGQSAP